MGRKAARKTVQSYYRTEVLRSSMRSSLANWASVRDNFQDMRREEVKSGRRYFFALHVEREKLLNGC